MGIDFPAHLMGVALGGSRGSTEMHPGWVVTSESSTSVLLPPETPIKSEKTFCTFTDDETLYFQKLYPRQYEWNCRKTFDKTTLSSLLSTGLLLSFKN